ncbi:hypothetical protein D3C76_796630 [compost metagenome]
MLDGAAADILEREGLGVLGPFIAHGSDQAGAAGAGQGKNREKVGFVQVHMQLAVEGCALGLDVGDIEHLLVGTSGEFDTQGLAHGRAGAVATGDIQGLAGFLMAGRSEQTRDDVLALIEKTEQFGIALDSNIELRQALDQQQFVLVLGEYLQERVGCQPLADSVQ